MAYLTELNIPIEMRMKKTFRLITNSSFKIWDVLEMMESGDELLLVIPDNQRVYQSLIDTNIIGYSMKITPAKKKVRILKV